MQLNNNILKKLEDVVTRNDKTVNSIIAKAILTFANTTTEVLIINDVAIASNTSVSSVTKFCQMLGFTGWKEFYIFFRNDVAAYNQNDKNLNNTTNSQIITEILSNHLLLFKTLLNENIKVLLELKVMMKSAQRIYLIGEHRYKELCVNFYHQLIVQNFDVKMTTHEFIAKKFLEQITVDDLIIWMLLDDQQQYLLSILKENLSIQENKNIQFIIQNYAPNFNNHMTKTEPIIINDGRKIQTNQTIYDNLFIIFSIILNLLN